MIFSLLITLKYECFDDEEEELESIEDYDG